ncbi:dUTP diphosphatase [Dehalobacter sp. 14DCB1]|uniref:dUTP diphosphatase n=1 Tax=Dehalobacter sp. 14DCB1 TaxID=2070227 RepID=UPI001043EC60|nr:dUTP diphosphatase [Dehalobacter sp. 14DCB1]TCX53817.1 deoxyuridine 5'-triphosphate nucleotidohydrolase [Dehalobacter sp. 14DCB1]
MSKGKFGFEVVRDDKRTAHDIFTDEKKVQHKFPCNITLPTRGSSKSAGYDFYVPKDIQILPGQKTMFFTDVKAFMPDGYVLLVFIRSSMGIKHGLMLSNNVGVIDCDYYSNPDNDGNIAMSLVNTSGIAVNLKAGDRVAQGIFVPFGVVDNDSTSEERISGIGSTGK